MRDWLNPLCAIAAAFLVACFAWHVATQERRERAAYLEGRYGLDHETAYNFAKESK